MHSSIAGVVKGVPGSEVLTPCCCLPWKMTYALGVLRRYRLPLLDYQFKIDGHLIRVLPSGSLYYFPAMSCEQ